MARDHLTNEPIWVPRPPFVAEDRLERNLAGFCAPGILLIELPFPVLPARPITSVPRLDMNHRLFAKLREGQARDATNGDRTAIGARTVLRGAVQVPFKEERPARRSARSDIHLHWISRMRSPRPKEIEG